MAELHHCANDMYHTSGRISKEEIGSKSDAKNTRITDDIITHNKTEYYSRTLVEVVDGRHNNDWILIMRYRTGK